MLRDAASLIDLEIRWLRLVSLMDEVDPSTLKTSFSTIVGDSRDFACILLDPDHAHCANRARALPAHRAR